MRLYDDILPPFCRHFAAISSLFCRPFVAETRFLRNMRAQPKSPAVSPPKKNTIFMVFTILFHLATFAASTWQ
jgi:hypothetical protein